MRKRYLQKSILAAAVAAAFLSGCGSAGGTKSSETADSTAVTAAETAETEEEPAPETVETKEKPEESSVDRPEKPAGEAPAGPGQAPPDGGPVGPGGGMPGGGASQPGSYDAAAVYSSDKSESGETYDSAGTDENAILVEGGSVTIDSSEISRTSEDSSGGDQASFYGVGAAALCTGGTLKITNSTITTDAEGGAGVFAYGDGVVYISDSSITTARDTSGGIHAAGGGTLYADNVTASTRGGSSAAIRSDRGGGSMVVTGGSYTSAGAGSPAVYCTADILVSNAQLSATGSEAVCIEGQNSLKLTDCNLSGSMPDDPEQNDNTWTVIVYQSMSGDSEEGCGSFTMKGGKLTSTNGGLFYTTNTESEITLENVRISVAKDCEFLLQCTGNQNARGWGKTGENGADCTFTATDQSMEGDVIWDSISTLDFYLNESSALVGAFRLDESWTDIEDGEDADGDGYAALYVDDSSVWVVTGDSRLTTLENRGLVTDPSGRIVTVAGIDGTVYVEGDSTYTVTVDEYRT